MTFTKTKIPGAYLIGLEPVNDHRGFFARTWCEREFATQGLETTLAQSGIAFNYSKGTLRGLHFQEAPDAETRLIRCTKGAIFDAIVDLRQDSVAYKQYFTVELSEINRRLLYVPKGVAHGYQTLEDWTEVSYWMSDTYVPKSAAGIRWNDPDLAIEWPLEPLILSERDSKLPLLDEYLSHLSRVPVGR